MRAWLLPPTLVLALATVQIPPPAPDRSPSPPEAAADQAPPRFEKLRWNPRERTARGLAHLERGDAASAVESFETAGRLAENDPLARFNAGTAELLGGAEGAIENLGFASQAAPPDLAPAAHYNLGNAQLAAGDLPGAIEAYQSSLRLAPGDRDVKHNLELALWAREQQQQQQQQEQQEREQEQPQQEQEEQEQPQEQEPTGEGEEPEEQPEQSEDGETEPQEPGEQPPDPSEERAERDLPDFDEQPDMTAEQAAAILEAVENLERDERRRQAAERARSQGKKGKDW